MSPNDRTNMFSTSNPDARSVRVCMQRPHSFPNCFTTVALIYRARGAHCIDDDPDVVDVVREAVVETITSGFPSCSPTSTRSTRSSSAHVAPDVERAFFVGPEGGLSSAEIDASTTEALARVSLGPLTLRIETVCAAVLGAVFVLADMAAKRSV